MIAYHAETGRAVPHIIALLLHGGSYLAQKTELSCCLCTYINVFKIKSSLSRRSLRTVTAQHPINEEKFTYLNYCDSNFAQV